jgi:4-amino-4-deoxy-L-arabinose transferase-like glycosyltransferase
MKRKHWIFVLIGFVTMLRLIYINCIPLLGDEAYYWQWARHLDWGYYEQGPMVAVVIWLFTVFTKISTVFTIRLGAVILSAATTISAYFTYKKFNPGDKDDRENLYLFALINFSIIYSIGSVLMMHDTVMVFFYALFLYNFINLIEEPEHKAHWMNAGILLGLGIMSKITMGTVYIAVLVLLLLTGSFKRYIKNFLLFTLFTALFSAPLIYWNFIHGFATVKYLFIRGNPGSGITLRYFFELIGSQIGLISPFIFLLFIPAFIKNGFRPAFEKKFGFTVLFWVSIIPYLLLSLKSRVEANWPAYTFLPMFFLAAPVLASSGKIWRNTVLYASLALVLFVHIQTAWPVIPLPEKNDPLKKTYGYKELAQKLYTDYKEFPGAKPFFWATRHYQTASLLSFYMPGQPEFYILINHESNKNYRFWKGYEKYRGGSCVFVYNEPWEIYEMSKFFSSTGVSTVLSVPTKYGSKKSYACIMKGLK